MFRLGVTREWVGKGELPKGANTIEVPWGVGDLIIQRYDRSDWRVGLLQCSHLFKGARKVRGQGQVVERGEKATTSPEGLNYPKNTRKQIVGPGLGSTMVPQRRDFHGVIDPLLLWRESVGRKRGRGGGEYEGLRVDVGVFDQETK
ncbi:hypothetical protein BHE74_00049333 [Ensete ventricosum]|nr:hypothetical protein BHE74_00049333 [Ensete ventricosum]